MSNSSNSDNGDLSGLVRFFEWDGSNWKQRGDLKGEAELEQFDSTVALSGSADR